MYRVPALMFLTLILALGQAEAQVLITNSSTSYSQNFNTLASSGTSSSLPTGWSISETGSNANTTYTAGSGSDNIGDSYSFGSAGSSDRALGGLLSGSLNPTFGVQIKIDSGSTNLESIAVSYIGEQWRLGSAGRVDRIDFAYSTNATSLSTGTWTDVDLLDFTSQVTTGPGAKVGNDPANRATRSASILSLNLAANQSIWFRWTDFNATGADDGLAVDDFSITGTFAAVPEPTSLLLVGSALTIFSLRRRR